MAPPKKRKKQEKQPTITEHALPQLKKPMEAVGKQVEFPGSFWCGRMSPEELLTLYTCTVRDYSSIAWRTSFNGGQLAPGPGFELQEMGVTGNGIARSTATRTVNASGLGANQPTAKRPLNFPSMRIEPGEAVAWL